MDGLQKIVLLIDADNTQLSKMEAVIREISTNGRIVVKRAYGNWKKEALKNWENELKRLAIKAEQQFDYVSGKNATDMALVIDAVNLLHRGDYDTFVIVASDSDYTPLAINLHESGVFVIGVGEKHTPEAFRNSCDDFLFLENLERTRKAIGSEKTEKSKKGSKGAKDNGKDNNKEGGKSNGADKANKSGAAADADKENTANETVGANALNEEIDADGAAVENEADEMEEIHNLLRLASDKFQDDDGFVNIGVAGQFIKRAKPDFDSRTFGFSKLSQLIGAFPEKYKMKRSSGKGNSTTITYKCK